jgi:hypothetical protein
MFFLSILWCSQSRRSWEEEEEEEEEDLAKFENKKNSKDPLSYIFGYIQESWNLEFF